jgi:predicted nucleotide-binding protein
MDKDAVKKILCENGYQVILDKPYKSYGYRLKLKQGSAVICYQNADKITGFGKLKEPLEKLLYSREKEWKYNNRVFLVYGHDNQAKEDMISALTEIGLEVLTIDRLPSEGRTIIEQLEHYIPRANFGIILATPDDVGYERNDRIERFRARQNVILEMGMLFAKLGRKRVVVIFKGASEEQELDFERPSDIEGILYISYSNSVAETVPRVIREMNNCGYRLN